MEEWGRALARLEIMTHICINVNCWVTSELFIGYYSDNNKKQDVKLKE